MTVHPLEFAGESHGEKITRLAEALKARAAVITLPDSIAWLLNIRGSDIERNPVPHGFAILHGSGSVDLFMAPEKLDETVRAHLGPTVRLHGPSEFGAALDGLEGPVQVDKATAPLWVSDRLAAKGTDVQWGQDPCLMPKARKNATELKGMEEAHRRDAAAMVEFLAWLDAEAPKGGLTEIAVAQNLESLRASDNALRDIAFETISGAGPNGAIVHYRVTEDTNRSVTPGELLLVDSGGQYLDGTTDITRTVATGPVTEEQKDCFTRVLQGMIAIHRVRWPRGLSGRDLDPLARFPLWSAGRDYDHGTGHGVGAYLSVHEGPQRLAKRSEVPLEEGMCLSNEPGYYREGAFGIRIENLVYVIKAPELVGADDRDMLAFQTLTFVPIDRRLIAVEELSRAERTWIDAYHRDCRTRLAGHVSEHAAAWLDLATAPI